MERFAGDVLGYDYIGQGLYSQIIEMEVGACCEYLCNG
jgi:hypothetical protein